MLASGLGKRLEKALLVLAERPIATAGSDWMQSFRFLGHRLPPTQSRRWRLLRAAIHRPPTTRKPPFVTQECYSCAIGSFEEEAVSGCRMVVVGSRPSKDIATETENLTRAAGN
jgi:hypothetical protein